MDITYTFPQFQETVLPNGLRVIWLEDHEQPVLKVAIQIPTGKQYDPPDREGTIELAAALAQKGPRALDAEEFSHKIESAGAQISGGVGEQVLTLDVHVLQMQANAIVALFWDMVCNPAMNPKEFDRLKREMLTEMQAEYADPASLAAKNLQVMVFGREHPGGRVHTADSTKHLSLDDAKRFWEKNIVPKGATVIVAGAFDSEQKAVWQKMFGEWEKVGEPAVLNVSRPATQKRTIIRLIDKPDLSQTTIMLGASTIGELHSDKIALSLGNYILGGGNFSSRLMNRVRSEIGKTYGIGSQLSCSREWGMFSISTNTRNQQLHEVLTVIHEVLRETFEKGVSEEELRKAKQFLLGHMAFELEGIHNVAEKLLWLRFYGREKTFIERYGSILNDIDVDRVNGALRDHYKRDGYVMVAVGNKKQIGAQLAEFGDVQERGFRGNPYK